MLKNGDFENGAESWTGNAANVTDELLGVDGTKANFASVATAGNPWDVNLSQVVKIDQGKNYKFSFKAKSDGSRSLIAGIGLNEEPFTNDTKTVNLTTEWQTYDLSLSSATFGGENSRILFDMGDDTGQVIIDQVSLTKVDDNSNNNSANASEAGVFSETHTASVLTYVGIINSIDWGGNTTVASSSSAITPLEGSTVLAVNFQDDGKGWGGAVFDFGEGGQDISSYTKLKFGVNTSGMPSFLDMQIKLEDPNTPADAEAVYLSNYTPTTSGEWSVYEIPVVDFPSNIDQTKLRYLGLWNTSSAVGATTPLVFGSLYFDDIHFVQ